MNNNHFFFTVKSSRTRNVLVLLGTIFLMTASATDLLAQLKAPPASAIIGSPSAGLPGGTPGSAIVGTPPGNLPGGTPGGAIIGSTGAGAPQPDIAPPNPVPTNTPPQPGLPTTNNPTPSTINGASTKPGTNSD